MGARGRSGEWEGLMLDGGSECVVFVSVLFTRRMNQIRYIAECQLEKEQAVDLPA